VVSVKPTMKELIECLKARESWVWDLILDWKVRMDAWVATRTNPTLIFVGAIVNEAYAWLREMFPLQATTHSFPWFHVVNSADRVELVGAVHPSAHLQSGGEAGSRALFKATFTAFGYISTHPGATPEEVMGALDETARNSAAHLIKACDALGILHTNGRLSENVAHMRHALALIFH